MNVTSDQVINVEGSPLPGNTFMGADLQKLLIQRLGAFLPNWHNGEGCPGKLMVGGKWLTGRFRVLIDFIPDTNDSSDKLVG